jgi:hypothetical protein
MTAIVRCKACDALKGELNHWRGVYIGRSIENGAPYFAAQEWNESFARDGRIAPTCGERCSLVLFERWLSTGSLERPQPNKITA